MLCHGDDQNEMNSSEQCLQDVSSKILQLPYTVFTREDNFFHMGNDSTTAMQIAAAIRNTGYNLTVGGVFRRPTAFAMAAAMVTLSTAKFSKATETTVTTGPLETTRFQAHCRTSHLLYPRAYSNYFFPDLETLLDVTRLQTVTARLVARFPILRTAFI
ncbi:Acyl carrier protein-like protein [Macrophomina phaseolina MS6]|uniref:Acyl carrier protein-like protein n=1 Tax=Macrophomina phaseolina (strain MS6) TaxID=1126212 RepID=K2S723_MACPH|nr:Acyl carrier protein-like protein [Macrophomina phaseolina MS6]